MATRRLVAAVLFLSWLGAASLRAEDVRYYEQNGVTYRETRRTVEQRSLVDTFLHPLPLRADVLVRQPRFPLCLFEIDKKESIFTKHPVSLIMQPGGFLMIVKYPEIPINLGVFNHY